MSSRTMINIPG